MSHPDTIVAAATPPGRGGVGIVRVSGPKTPEIARRCSASCRRAVAPRFARFLDARRPADRHRPRAVLPGAAVLHRRARARAARPRRAGDPRGADRARAAARRAPRAARANSPSAPSSTTSSISRRPRPSPISSTPARATPRARRMRSLQGEFSRMVHGLTRCADRSAHLRRGGDRLSRRGDRLPRRPASSRERLARVREHFDAVLAAGARQGACCATA